MLHYAWPGNVRELRNVIETLCLLRGGREARVSDLPEATRRPVKDSPATAPGTTVTLSLDQPLETLVGSIVQSALALDGGNRTQAAARLGVSVRTLQRYIAAGRVSDPPGHH